MNKLKIKQELMKYPELARRYKTAKAIPLQVYTINKGRGVIEVYLPDREHPYIVKGAR